MTYKKWSWLITPIMLLLTFSACAQVDPALESLRNLVPPSPNSSSLGRYAEWPVSLYTGVPNISIPIYELKGRGVKVPIDISYHASGNRVGDVASWVGLGWNLNAGASITRSVRGLPDEDSYFTYASYYADPNNFTSQTTPTDYREKHQADAANQNGDSQQDLYTLSVMGRSYRLLLKADGSVTTMPLSNLKITYSMPNSWTVIMEDGTQILFGGSSSFYEENTITYGMQAGGIQFPTTWYIQTITSPVGEQVNFTYTAYQITQDTHFTESDWIQYKTSDNLSTTNMACTLVSNSGGTSTHLQNQTVYMLSPATIESDLTRVTFIPQTANRQDLNGSHALSEITVFSKAANKIVEDYKFLYSYTQAAVTLGNELPLNPSDSSYVHHRLKLDSLQKVATDLSSTQTWAFQYNPLHLPSRRSYAQDHLGFYNGATGNTTLLPKVYFALPASAYWGSSFQYASGFMPTTHTMGANRGFSGSYMQAELLTKITYPTGGYTQFNFEPNSIPVTNVEQFADTYINPALTVNQANTTTSNSTTFTITKPQYVTLAVTANFSSSLNSDQPNKSAGAVIKDSNGNTISGLTFTATNTTTSFSGTAYINLLTAGTYTLVLSTNVSTATMNSSDNLYVTTSLLYSKSLGNQNFNQMVGGLRVKSILNYDGVNPQPINDKYFSYAEGFVINPIDSLNDYLTTQNSLTTSTVVQGDQYVIQNCAFTKVTRNSSTKFSLGSIQGGAIGYGAVTTLYGPTGANGKTISQFTNVPDNGTTNAKLFPYPPTDPREWQRGLLFYEATYNAASTPVKSIANNYAFHDSSIYVVTNFAAGFSTIYGSGTCTNQYGWCGITAPPFTTSSEQVLHRWSTETTYNTLGTDSVSTTKTYTYEDPANMQPTKVTMTNSKGDVIINYNRTALEASTINTSIPLSANANTALTAMVTSNMVGLPVESERYVNGNVTDKLLINYQTFGSYILPQEVQNQVGSNTIQSRMMITNYDAYGNLLEQQKTTGPLNDYIYDYANSYVVASVVNGSQADIAYTSFESTGFGNWTMSNTTIDGTTAAFTGIKSFNLGNGSITKSGLNTAKTYIVSYWTKSAAPNTVSGTISGSVITGPTLKGWTYYEHQVTGQSTITVSGTGNIDELRLYPQGAQMTSYTYDPLIGLTSSCDTKDEPTYYVYDGMNRLITVKNKDGNIIKQMTYHYQGQ